MSSSCFLDFSVGVGVFVKGLSQISSVFSYFSKIATSRMEVPNSEMLMARRGLVLHRLLYMQWNIFIDVCV